MIIVIIPVLFLFIVSIWKKLPYIGGNMVVALVGSGLIALLLGKVFNPLQWFPAWMQGLNQISWILWLIIIGTIFSGVQQQLGALETVLDLFRALLGRTAKGLVCAILIALYIGGALIGSTTAVGAVVGVLVVPALAAIGLSPELICAIIVTGASMGSIMPPISQAVTLSASLLDIDPAPAINIAYFTVGIGLVLVTAFILKFYIKKEHKIREEDLPTESAGAIFKARWKSLIPIFILITLVLMKSISAIGFDLPMWLLNLPKFGDKTLGDLIKAIPIVGTITNNIVMSVLTSTILSFIIFKKVRQNTKEIFKFTWDSLRKTLGIQLAAAFMLGGYRAGGQIQLVTEFAQTLSANALKIGGGVALTGAGMLLGAQSTSQTTIFTIVGPMWTSIGVSPVHAAIAGSHLASAGQGFPPADINTFAIAGLVSSILGKKIDPLKSMYYSSVFCFYFFIVGMLFLYI